MRARAFIRRKVPFEGMTHDISTTPEMSNAKPERSRATSCETRRSEAFGNEDKRSKLKVTRAKGSEVALGNANPSGEKRCWRGETNTGEKRS